MSVFDDIKEGLEEAIRHARGEPTDARVYSVKRVSVAEVRQRLGLSQAAFARAFGVSVDTVQNWEQGRRRPSGPARVLLTLVDREPEAVMRALHIQIPHGPAVESADVTKKAS